MSFKLKYNTIGWREWKNDQEKHRGKIHEIYASASSSRIDNKLPDVFKNTSSSRTHLTSVYGSSLKVREIDIKNAKILEKLTRMARSPVVLKTLPLAENRVNTRKYFLKKLENGRLHQENLLFAKRLAKTSSSVNFRQFEKDFTNNQKYAKIRQKLKLKTLDS